MNHRHLKNSIFKYTCILVVILSIAILGILIGQIIQQGHSWVTMDFLKNFPSRLPSRAGIKAGLWGTLWLLGLTALLAIPIGIFSAVALEEYMRESKIKKWLQINVSNLAGLPSIVYGLLGLSIFVRGLGMGRSLWAGSLTMALLVLPVIIIASQESIRAVPKTIREAAYALGARKWQVVFMQVLPASVPGIMTGIILALSRVAGESAPLIVIGALTFVNFVPQGPSDSFSALPIQIFNWSSRPQEEFHGLAAGAIIVLLGILFSLNLVAVFIRERYQRYRT
ncbi:MAG: phosphate ABC transporter permease PstA [Pseudomonadota bacterium]|nr:phosphate ABC transporter permease PstA [Pseudomonadota bacterium]